MPKMKKRWRTITVQGAVKKILIQLLQYWKNLQFDRTRTILHFESTILFSSTIYDHISKPEILRDTYPRGCFTRFISSYSDINLFQEAKVLRTQLKNPPIQINDPVIEKIVRKLHQLIPKTHSIIIFQCYLSLVPVLKQYIYF